MDKKSSYINQFDENVEEYELDIGTKIQRESIPMIMNAVCQPGVQIIKYGLHYSDADNDHSITSEKPVHIAGILWNEDYWIEQLDIWCKVGTFRFCVRIEIGTKCIVVDYPHDTPNPSFVESLLSAIEASLRGNK